MVNRRLTLAFPGGAESSEAFRWGSHAEVEYSVHRFSQPRLLTKWDRKREKLRQEDEIKKALFESPKLACIEKAELRDAADALEATIARIPKSSWSVGREVEDERENIVGPPTRPAHQNQGLSLSDIFSH